MVKFNFFLKCNITSIMNNKDDVITEYEKNTNGKTESMPMDELVMKANKISTTFSVKNGFALIPYSVSQQGAPASHLLDFTAESTNSQKDVLKWSGTINGNSVTGKAQRIHNGNPAGEYTFSGTLKNKK